jgi:hypothetical protein
MSYAMTYVVVVEVFDSRAIGQKTTLYAFKSVVLVEVFQSRSNEAKHHTIPYTTMYVCRRSSCTNHLSPNTLEKKERKNLKN